LMFGWIEMAKFSKEVLEMLRLGRGYNCESYGEYDGWRPYKGVLEHEVLAMQNEHVLEDAAKALGVDCDLKYYKQRIPGWPTVDVPYSNSVSACMRVVQREIDRRFGPDSDVIWLATNADVRARYCAPGERPVKYPIPRNALVLSDLDGDGALFLFPSISQPPEKMPRGA
jgi:hypothetical protein